MSDNVDHPQDISPQNNSKKLNIAIDILIEYLLQSHSSSLTAKQIEEYSHKPSQENQMTPNSDVNYP